EGSRGGGGKNPAAAWGDQGGSALGGAESVPVGLDDACRSRAPEPVPEQPIVRPDRAEIDGQHRPGRGERRLLILRWRHDALVPSHRRDGNAVSGQRRKDRNTIDLPVIEYLFCDLTERKSPRAKVV